MSDDLKVKDEKSAENRLKTAPATETGRAYRHSGSFRVVGTFGGGALGL